MIKLFDPRVTANKLSKRFKKASKTVSKVMDDTGKALTTGYKSGVQLVGKKKKRYKKRYYG